MAKSVKPIEAPDFSGEIDSEYIGKVVRARRTKSGLTLEQACALCGVAKQTLMSIEHGNEKAQIGKVLQILKGLGIVLVIDQPNKEALDEWT
ncbi:MAG: helix-turn-helix domain-containing protein [Thiomicrorhabdus sp.]|nr:helix-turn-helix domain-containing protein [Thiomicrorhabdus sp.]